jgi:ribonucleotide monophosphatase NagD (HAD superfamily)
MATASGAAALEYAAQVEATVFGKPAPAFFDPVLADLGTAPDETVMIGDDVEADVNGTLAVGLQAARGSKVTRRFATTSC